MDTWPKVHQILDTGPDLGQMARNRRDLSHMARTKADFGYLVRTRSYPGHMTRYRPDVAQNKATFKLELGRSEAICRTDVSQKLPDVRQN